MHMLVGLGNPGPEYTRNRHNIGFMAVDAIHHRHDFPPWRGKFQGSITAGALAGEKVLLLKPATFMNESGRAVAEAVRFYKFGRDEIAGLLIVFHDELDLEPGRVRVKSGGGLAGHNGLKSIASHLGPDFRRVRIGIGHPGDKDRVSGHVLHDFAKSDEVWIAKLVDAMADAVANLIGGDDARFATDVSLAMSPPRRKSAPDSENGT